MSRSLGLHTSAAHFQPRKQAMGAFIDSCPFGMPLLLWMHSLAAYGFTEIPDGLLEAELHGLKSLDLSNNNLRSLTLKCPALVHLDVTNNELESLDGVSTLSSLTSLDCADNRR